MTLTELYTAALQDIGVLAAGEVAEADDAAKVAQKYASLYEMLREKSLVGWEATEAIPSYADIPLTYMLGFLCCPAFGVAGQKFIDAGLLGSLDATPPSLAEKMLRRQFAKAYIYKPAKPDYF